MSITNLSYEAESLYVNAKRMFHTDDEAELLEMYEVAKERIERIYEYHHARLCEGVQNGE